MAYRSLCTDCAKANGSCEGCGYTERAEDAGKLDSGEKQQSSSAGAGMKDNHAMDNSANMRCEDGNHADELPQD